MTRLRRYITAIAALVAVTAVIYYYAKFDPSIALSFRCPIKTLTGIDCPGCGSQRALHALLIGNFSEAWSFNPFIFFAAPIAALYILVESYPKHFSRLRQLIVRPSVVTMLLLAIVGWTVFRNLFD